MNHPESDNLSRARDYLAALERGATGDDLAGFFTPDVIQEEFPNRLTPNGARRDLAALLDGAARAKNVIARQHFEILNELAENDTVVLEIQWSATLAIQIGSLAPGDEMRARFAVFLEFRDGKIARQRNYDCFEP